MPAALLNHLLDRELGDVDETGQVHGGDRGEVLDRVFGERLADVDASVVDQRVDPREPLERSIDGPSRRVWVGDVARDRDVAVVVPHKERQRNADERTSRAAIPGGETRADPPEAPVMSATAGALAGRGRSEPDVAGAGRSKNASGTTVTLPRVRIRRALANSSSGWARVLPVAGLRRRPVVQCGRGGERQSGLARSYDAAA